ncbi:serine/threonine protein kinase, CMGC, CDC2/CDK sub [Irineochytrium annulatum]|nr:serine/threonine protein kinase, CMGC, CDC2/CDK sub [Irineochytrium annulatum]
MGFAPDAPPPEPPAPVAGRQPDDRSGQLGKHAREDECGTVNENEGEIKDGAEDGARAKRARSSDPMEMDRGKEGMEEGEEGEMEDGGVSRGNSLESLDVEGSDGRFQQDVSKSPDEEPARTPPRAPMHLATYGFNDDLEDGEASAAPTSASPDLPNGSLNVLSADPNGNETTYVPNSPPLSFDSASPNLVTANAEASPRVGTITTSTKPELRNFFGCSSVEEYEMRKKVGEGTFGEVNCMIHKKSGKTFALKKILMHNEKEGIPITALREIRILKSLNHKNIVELTEMAVKSGNKQERKRGDIFMVFPYMDHDLNGLLDNPNVKFSPAQIKSYTRQLLEGTRHLHANNILHRDMKTANILVDSRGNLQIADFGLARAFQPKNLNANYTNCVVTRWYRPPELLMGAIKYGPAIDMWGVGRRPILQGNDDLDQLDKIFQLCGTPNEQSWPKLNDLPAMSLISSFKTTYPRSIKEKFKHFDMDIRFDGAVELLEGLLTCNPEQRITAEVAVSHRFFFVPPRAAEPNTDE